MQILHCYFVPFLGTNNRSYCFNIGDVHYTSIFLPGKNLTDEQLAWIDADLATARKDNDACALFAPLSHTSQLTCLVCGARPEWVGALGITPAMSALLHRGQSSSQGRAALSHGATGSSPLGPRTNRSRKRRRGAGARAARPARRPVVVRAPPPPAPTQKHAHGLEVRLKLRDWKPRARRCHRFRWAQGL